MIIKLGKLISCSSQHPSYPATNLIDHRTSGIGSLTWLCAEPGIREAQAIFELAEPAPITGIDIGNSRCCSVKIAGSTINNPKEWVIIVHHEFMSFNDADDGRFKDQVQLFTKNEISEEIRQMIFNKVKITCMQPANMKVLFGLSFLILRTVDKVDEENLDTFGRFKIKTNKDDSIDKFKEKYLQQIRPKPSNFKAELAKQIENNRTTAMNGKSDEAKPRKRPFLQSTSPNTKQSDQTSKREKNESVKTDEEHLVKRSKFSERKTSNSKQTFQTTVVDHTGVQDEKKADYSSKDKTTTTTNLNNTGTSSEHSLLKDITPRGRSRCSLCLGNEENILCKTCNLLLPEKNQIEKHTARKPARPKKKTKKFNALFDDVVFSLSGYQHPQRDEIRKKAIAMGAKYIFDVNWRNHGCTHLVCAFKNTPKYKQLKGTAKIVSHQWVEDCYERKKRLPWRRYALDITDKIGVMSEDEIDASDEPAEPSNVYDQDTDSDY